MRKQKAFTLIELLVVISIIALLIGILLPALAAARRTANQMVSNSQLRGIHQEMYIFGQGNGGYYPGLNGSGQITTASTTAGILASGDGDTVEQRFAIMLNQNYFAGDYIISPAESKVAWTDTDNPLETNGDSGGYSYAMLSINNDATAGQAPDAAGRANEWNEASLNSQAIILSDRTLDDTNYFSVFTSDPGSGTDWRGGVVYNDNHAETATTHVLSTKYSSANVIAEDNLFDDDDQPTGTAAGATPDDSEAFMVYTGNAGVVE